MRLNFDDCNSHFALLTVLTIIYSMLVGPRMVSCLQRKKSGLQVFKGSIIMKVRRFLEGLKIKMTIQSSSEVILMRRSFLEQNSFGVLLHE